MKKMAGSKGRESLGCESALSPGVKLPTGRGLTVAKWRGGNGEAFLGLAGVQALQTLLASK